MWRKLGMSLSFQPFAGAWAVFACFAWVVVGSFSGAGCEWARSRQVRAIQMSAPADLELLLRAEQEYRAQLGSFTTDLGSLPLKRKDLKSVLYKFGFTVPAREKPGPRAPAALDPGRMDLDLLRASRPDIEIEYSPTTKLSAIDFARLAAFCPDCTATATKFKAIAAADLSDGASGRAWAGASGRPASEVGKRAGEGASTGQVLDLWTIDQSGTVHHLVDGLR
jgi:hypothetical protein